MGRRRPDSSLESVLAEMPVCSARSASVTSRRSRRRLRRGPTALSVWSRSSVMGPFCHSATPLAHPPACSGPSNLKRKSDRKGFDMAGTAETSARGSAGARDGDAMTHSFDKDYWEQHWEQAHGAAPGRLGRSCPEPASHPRNQRTRTGYSAGCRVRDRGRGNLAGRARLAGHRRRHLRRCPRPSGRACRTAVRVRHGDLGRGGPDVMGAGWSVRPCDHPLRAPGDAATGLLRTHLGLGSPGRHAVDRRAPARSRLPGTRAPPSRRSDCHPRGHHRGSRRCRMEASTSAEEITRTLPGPGDRASPLHDVVVRATRRG